VGHHSFKVEESGLFISTEYPFVGAPPDGFGNMCLLQWWVEWKSVCLTGLYIS